MKILQLTNKTPYPPKDGGAIATLSLAEGLADAGHEVLMLCLNSGCFAQVKRITLTIQQSSMDRCLHNDIGITTVNQLDVFPNPSDGHFTISFGVAGLGSMVLIQVISLMGEILESYEELPLKFNYQKKLELDTLPSGIYLIKISGDGFSAHERVVIL